MLKNDEIHEAARRLGFAACGATRLHTVPDTEMARLDKWLSEGRAAGMAYMQRYREIRRDPTLLLPGARVVISLAMGYTPAVEIEGFAHYAYGRDYHDVLRSRAGELVRMLGMETARVCVDTAPVLERYWAQQCGVGWIGRNRQLVVPTAGGEVFLCEILTTDDIDRCDEPCEPRCGTCRRCLEACPTGALGEDGIDARRCNSYLTIEHRGEFTDHRPSPGCIYGCDRCVVACPWQRYARPTTEADFQPSTTLLSMTPEGWRALTPDDFSTLFRHSAVTRAKYSGLMRNVMAAGM